MTVMEPNFRLAGLKEVGHLEGDCREVWVLSRNTGQESCHITILGNYASRRREDLKPLIQWWQLNMLNSLMQLNMYLTKAFISPLLQNLQSPYSEEKRAYNGFD